MADDDYRDIDTIVDGSGDAVQVGVIGSVVALSIDDGHGEMLAVHFDAGQRDRFAKAYAEAERQAEAHAAQQGADHG